VTFTHGFASKSPRRSEYRIWEAMWRRCTVKTDAAYVNYGGRGIRICVRWKKFENFLSDMGLRPAKKVLDRRDNDGNYTPKNCRWVTRRTSSINRRTRTHCLSGHKYTKENTGKSGAYRICRMCRKRSRLALKQKKGYWT